jgi:eukaryotic-like serine/threonine-protein kinase
MSAARWPEVEALLDAVLELPPPARDAHLDDPATGDPELRAEVRRLLRSQALAERYFERPATEFAEELMTGPGEADDPPRPAASGKVGPYRIRGEAGHGGMGTVYLAERDDEQFQQKVALKLVRGAMLADEHLVSRFREERQILASLSHPHIARLLDGGVTGEGLPWFAMEYVSGVPIDVYCEQNRLNLPARIELFRTVCDAVQYAHRKLVVHLDLKPSNILVTEGGEPKLLDFGVARLVDPANSPVGLAATHAGLRLLTPEYASPEQVRGDPVTTASDVYSLGVLLYRLLSGVAPYAATGRPHELARAIQDAQPPRPSSVAPVSLRRRLRGDLDTIVLRALQKEPERRYPSVQALSSDLRRHLESHPVQARPDTRRYRAGRFIRRHRAGVGAAALLLLVLTGGLVGTAWQAREALRQAERAEVVRAFLVSLFEASDPAESRGDAITARELLDRGAERAVAELAGRPALQAEMLGVLGGIYRDLGSYPRAEPLLRTAVELRRDARGGGDPATAAALFELAQLLVAMGRRSEAEATHREALALRRSSLGPRHPDVGRSLGALGTVLGRAGEYEEAERLHREGLDLLVRHHGGDHPDVAAAMDELGSLLRARGSFAEAEEVWRNTLSLRSRVLGPDHLATATSTNNLALLLSDRGELEEAEALYRQVLDFDLRRLGEEHPYTASVMNNLASVLRRKGELSAAEDLYRRALEIDRALHGDAHPKVATVLNNLAAVLRDRGELAESERLYREALAAFLAANGDGHPSVGTAHAVLANVLYLRGDTVGAERRYRLGLEILRGTFPEGHVRTASALVGLGRLLVESGRAAEAEPLLQEALATREEALGTDNARSSEARTELGASLLAQGRHAEAEPLLRASHAALLPLKGAENERLRRRAGQQLATLFVATGRPGEAARYGQEP